MAFIEPMHRNKPNITYLLMCPLGYQDNKTVLANAGDEMYQLVLNTMSADALAPRVADA